MKRIFSGINSLSPPTNEFAAPPRNLFSDEPCTTSDKKNGKSRSRSSSFGRIFSNTSDSSTSNRTSSTFPKEETSKTLSPELIPIVTLLSAQTHRRYNDGVFLMLKDLKSDGTPADRSWKEVYGVLIGTQLAIWDASELSENGTDPQKLMEATKKPNYINFTDAQIRLLDRNDQVVRSSNKNVENCMVVSTTLKNRYFLQFADRSSFEKWHTAFRLSAFEFTSLQESYTGAFLSTRGSKLSDIKVILSDTKFKYEDWVSVRFGAGMPWKRCYAVISQPSKRNKDGKRKHLGKITFYENDKKLKPTNAMATVNDAYAVYAIYPQSPVLIDTSTMIKIEGKVSFGKKDSDKDSERDTDIFIMPEKHFSVPGYDTIIRFLVPTMNAFLLYGRPTRLIASKENKQSLLFALPTLPHVHYVEIEDIISLAKQSASTHWKNHEWRDEIKNILSSKLRSGYTGCGSSTNILGVLSSPAIASSELFTAPSDSLPFAMSPKFSASPNSNCFESKVSSPLRVTSLEADRSTLPSEAPSIPTIKLDGLNAKISKGPSSELYSSTTSSSFDRNRTLNSDDVNSNSNEMKKTVPPIKLEHSNYDGFEDLSQRSSTQLQAVDETNGRNSNYRLSDLGQIYEKYNTNSISASKEQTVASDSFGFESQNTMKNSSSAYKEYTGSPEVRKIDISNVNESETDSDNEAVDSADVLDDFYQLTNEISSLSIPTEKKQQTGSQEFEFAFEDQNVKLSSDNVFDPDYEEQNEILGMDSKFTSKNRSSDTIGSKGYQSAQDSLPPNSTERYNGLPKSRPLADLANANKMDLTKPQMLPKGNGTAQSFAHPRSFKNDSNVELRNESTQSNRRVSPGPPNGIRPVGGQHASQLLSYNQQPIVGGQPAPNQSNLQQMKYRHPTTPIVQGSYNPYGNPTQQRTNQKQPQRTPYTSQSMNQQNAVGNQQYATQQYATQQYAPQQYAPQQYAPQQYAPQQYAPQQYAPQQYAPQQYTPQPYAPQHYQNQQADKNKLAANNHNSQSQGKTRSPLDGGFSKFMPSTQNNPYSKA